MSKYNETDGLTTLEPTDDAATFNWGSAWRMPTAAEFRTLIANTTSALTANYEGSGVSGLVLTSNEDNSIELFFPIAGECYQGSIINNTYGYYWTRNNYLSDYSRAREFYIRYEENSYGVGNIARRYGLPIRAVIAE